jgi:hypothetical protein
LHVHKRQPLTHGEGLEQRALLQARALVRGQARAVGLPSAHCLVAVLFHFQFHTMDEAMKVRFLLAAASVNALVRHAAMQPSEVLPSGPLTRACRRALRAVLTNYNSSDEMLKLVAVQDRFLRHKLLPPVRWGFSGDAVRPRHLTAEFVGVLQQVLTVDMRWVSVPPRQRDVLQVCVNRDKQCIWSGSFQHRTFPPPWPLEYLGPCAATVATCVRIMVLREVAPVGLELCDRFYDAVRTASAVRDTWAAVTQAAQFGMCGAAAMPWTFHGRVVFARWPPLQRNYDNFTAHAWVLVAAGAKPRALLQGEPLLALDMAAKHKVIYDMIAAALLAGADWARPSWDPWNTLQYWYLADNALFTRALDAWPAAWAPPRRGCAAFVSTERDGRWTPGRAAWLVASMQ